MFADDVAEVRAMELANTEATEAAAPLDLPSQRSNGKPVVRCYICDKEFKSVSSLNKHLKIHFDGMYSCKFCGKRQQLFNHVLRPFLTSMLSNITPLQNVTMFINFGSHSTALV